MVQRGAPYTSYNNRKHSEKNEICILLISLKKKKKYKYNIEIPVFMKNAAMTRSAIQRSGFESH